MHSPIPIRHARPDDRGAVEALLTEASLPLEGVKEHFDSFLVAEDFGGIKGAIGMEIYDRSALLRSLVVAKDSRAGGIGSALYDALLADARRQGIVDIVLLTTTASGFFARKGFCSVARTSIVGPMTSSAEFTGACPSSATVMRLTL